MEEDEALRSLGERNQERIRGRYEVLQVDMLRGWGEMPSGLQNLDSRLRRRLRWVEGDGRTEMKVGGQWVGLYPLDGAGQGLV